MSDDVLNTFSRRLFLCAVAMALLSWAMATAGTTIAMAQQGGSDPVDFDKVASRAEAARQEDRTGEAIDLYRKGLSLRPRWAEGWWYLGTLLYERDAFDE